MSAHTERFAAILRAARAYREAVMAYIDEDRATRSHRSPAGQAMSARQAAFDELVRDEASRAVLVDHFVALADVMGIASEPPATPRGPA